MNEYRNEFKLELGENVYILRATFEALVTIESALRMNIMAVYKKIVNDEASLLDARTIIIAGLEGAETKVDENLIKQIQNDFIIDGWAKAADPICRFLSVALDGGKLLKKD